MARSPRAHICRSASVFVRFIRERWREICESQFHERREHGACEMGTPVICENVADFLAQVAQAHAFACEAAQKLARRSCRRAKTQLAQQVEQLFEHLPPTAAGIRWPRL